MVPNVWPVPTSSSSVLTVQPSKVDFAVCDAFFFFLATFLPTAACVLSACATALARAS
jgi:hypothetical protein